LNAEQNNTILFVDDEPNVVQALLRIFRNKPYSILTALSGREALEILERQQVQVIVSDLNMPEMNGLQLLKRVKKMHPHIVGIIFSGNLNKTSLMTAINQNELFGCVEKGSSIREILPETIQKALEHYCNSEV